MTPATDDASSHVVVAAIPQPRFRANPSWQIHLPTPDRPTRRAAAQKIVPPLNAWLHEPFAGTGSAGEPFHAKALLAQT
jgi:hypothetical protein